MFDDRDAAILMRLVTVLEQTKRNSDDIKALLQRLVEAAERAHPPA